MGFWSFWKQERKAGGELTDFQKGNQLLVTKAYAEAIALYVSHAEKHPEDAAKAYAAAGECCSRSNVLKGPVAVAPGVALVSQGDRKGAEHYYRLALQHDPTNFRALFGLSELVPEKSDERLDLLERAVAKQPGVICLVELGDYWRTHRKDYEKAYGFYKRAIEHAEKDETGYTRICDMCRRLGRPEEAEMWKGKWEEAKKRKMDFGTGWKGA